TEGCAARIQCEIQQMSSSMPPIPPAERTDTDVESIPTHRPHYLYRRRSLPMSPHSTPTLAPCELSDTDLERLTAGKEVGGSFLRQFTPGFWLGAFNPKNWQVMTGKESIDFLQAHNML